MKTKVLWVFAIFSAVIIACGLLFSVKISSEMQAVPEINTAVILNEISHLAKENSPNLNEKIAELGKVIDSANAAETGAPQSVVFIWLACAAVILFALILTLYVYFRIIRPFDKLKSFAAEIAAGNLEIPLNYERTNFFGDFTWAFDHMRKELKKAQICEKEAIEANKTIVGALSHDIKTPIASISAYAEALEANIAATPEEMRHYTDVIMRKCAEVKKLTDDLFMHSVADMDKLKITSEPVEISALIADIIESSAVSGIEIVNLEQAELMLDSKRFAQAVGNVIANSQKYAKGSKITVSASKIGKSYRVKIRDFGEGISDEDMPFVTEKFYRGKNTSGENGAGLGLYIVKYITEKMNGTLEIDNHSGTEIIFSFPITS